MQSTTGNYSTQLEAYILPSITSNQPCVDLNIESWNLPSNLELADPSFNKSKHIDVLLGAEFFPELMQSGQIKLKETLPTLFNTILGWIISGTCANAFNYRKVCGVLTESQHSLDKKLERWWNTEEIESADKSFTPSNRQCEDIFTKPTTRSQTNKFIVRLPFKDDPIVLGDSRKIAMNRFLAIERRMQQDGLLREQYVKFMSEYEALGHMTEIKPGDTTSTGSYLPHHCVIKPDRTTTKLRVVFDASARTSSGISLNDILHVGPTVQTDLFSLILKFRLPKFVFTTDIEKMYRQVLIHTQDRKYQRIIWRNNPEEPLKHYELNTVTYGMCSAPYLATKCLQQLGQEFLQSYPLGDSTILNNFYVDDCLAGADSLATALDMQVQTQTILESVGFKLRKWCANHSQLLSAIAREDQEVNLNFDEDDDSSIKSLGLTWTPTKDTLCFRMHLSEITTITKRSIVSDVARIFDPLGILAPATVIAKLIIQDAWQLGLSWDTQLPDSLQQRWKEFRTKLIDANNKPIQRRVVDLGGKKGWQIYTFVDASKKAYGAVIYLRSYNNQGSPIIRRLCAKSRVAPLKPQTIPRLELCAALLGTRLITKVRKELKLRNASTYIWSDSQIVLSWIESTSNTLEQFIINRITKIRELAHNVQWLHIESKNNPADLISRGMFPAQLWNNSFWFHGPLLLQQANDAWTTYIDKNKIHRQSTTMPITSYPTTEENVHPIFQINHRNSFQTLQRVTAYILRFCRGILRNKEFRNTPASMLSLEELSNAETVILKAIQKETFKNEVVALTHQRDLNNSSNLRDLKPLLDDHGLTRVGGRLHAASLSYDARHPIILPHNDSIMKLILRKFHIQHYHCGVQALLAQVRSRFWPIKGKSMARSIKQNCVRCNKVKPKLFQQIMGNLPSTRIMPTRPFINSGVDFCGPFFVHFKIRGKAPRKAYVAIFCCFSTKAVHLELVSDLTTEAFIGCLKRFIARRGHCLNLYCDNATNFVGASKQLSAL